MMRIIIIREAVTRASILGVHCARDLTTRMVVRHDLHLVWGSVTLPVVADTLVETTENYI